jgi:hypothetical protein
MKRKLHEKYFQNLSDANTLDSSLRHSRSLVQWGRTGEHARLPHDRDLIQKPAPDCYMPLRRPNILQPKLQVQKPRRLLQQPPETLLRQSWDALEALAAR